jgi:hypothetical protein
MATSDLGRQVPMLLASRSSSSISPSCPALHPGPIINRMARVMFRRLINLSRMFNIPFTFSCMIFLLLFNVAKAMPCGGTIQRGENLKDY